MEHIWYDGFWFLIGKMPKNPDAEIDPERWLPRKERSYYRGKRRDKRKEIGKFIISRISISHYFELFIV